MIKILKLFEVAQSYEKLAETCEAVLHRSKVEMKILESTIYRAQAEDNDYGYLNITKWESMDIFRNSLNSDDVLYYHFYNKSAPKRSGHCTLYKMISEKIFDPETYPSRNGYVGIAEFENKPLKNMMVLWKDMLEAERLSKPIFSSALFTSIERSSEHKYLITMNCTVPESLSAKRIYERI